MKNWYENKQKHTPKKNKTGQLMRQGGLLSQVGWIDQNFAYLSTDYRVETLFWEFNINSFLNDQ